MPIKVLVADDEHGIAVTLSYILAQHGYAAKAVYDGESAVRLARDWKPAIFLTDMAMPRMNGYKAAVKVRSILPRCRVILHSSRYQSADELPWRQGHRAFEVLPKPVHPSILLETVRAAT